MAIAKAPRYSSAWLELREDADAQARAADLLVPLCRHLADVSPLVIRDLGCGTGSMGRWLTGRLPGPQHWVLQDRDADLLDVAADSLAGVGVTTETRLGDITTVTAADLAGTSLVTASALLDLLTREEVDRIAAACAGAGCPALITMTVVGRVDFSPADPLDAQLVAGFNDHMRTVGAHGRRPLGPSAADAAAEAFRRHGATVLVRETPWRLGPERADLTAEWLRGWVPASVAQRPALAAHSDAYLARRLDELAAGTLRVTLEHIDLLALPAGSSASCGGAA